MFWSKVEKRVPDGVQDTPKCNKKRSEKNDRKHYEKRSCGSRGTGATFELGGEPPPTTPRALFPAGLHFQPRPSQAKPSQAQGNLRDTPLVPEARWRILTFK